MYKKIAKGISYVLHPVFLPSLLVIALKLFAPLPVFYIFLSPKLFFVLFTFIACYTMVIPLGFMYLQYRMGFIQDFELNARSERPKVYLFTSGFYFALAYFLNAKGSVFMPTAVIIAAMAIVIFGLFLYNFFDKISAHTAGAAGVLGIFIAIFIRYGDTRLLPVVLSLVVLLGLVASSRLYLGSHNIRQVVLGAVWGLTVGFIGVFNFMKL